jgi:O-antigen/teichoic acid export membrane protein
VPDVLPVQLYHDGSGIRIALVRAVPAAVLSERVEQLGQRVAKNVASRYAALVIDAVIGFAMLPFNLAHLGTAAYGVWMLAASVTVHFSLLDLGFGSAFVRFVAQYRARQDARGLSEIASTLFFVYAGLGAVAYAIAATLAFNLDHLFQITPEQADTGKWLLLVLGLHLALTLPFSIYGGVVNGYQCYHVNSMVAIACSVTVASANVIVLSTGYGLVSLVITTTLVKLVFLLIYRTNAHRVCPALQVRVSLVGRHRLREVMGFSVYTLLLDVGYRLNYQLDQLVIGSFLGATPVAVWAPPTRIVTATQQLTNQLNPVLFPTIVESDASAATARLRGILLHGTRLTLALVLPLVVALIALADPIIHIWIGNSVPEMMGAVPVLQLLALVTLIRVGAGTATTLLKGANRHQLLAAASVGTGVANVVLSIALVRGFGLPGVALGTLLPLAASTGFVVFPAACRRVDLPPWRLVVYSVLPALWPAAVVGIAYAVLPVPVPHRLAALALHAAFIAISYLALFGVAVGHEGRRRYILMVRALVQRADGTVSPGLVDVQAIGSPICTADRPSSPRARTPDAEGLSPQRVAAE